MTGSDWKRNIILNAKNLIGWRTDRKIVVFSVDDYGNVRLDSKAARDNLDADNITVKSPFAGFDMYDALETKEDLEALFEVLSSVKDLNGRNAVFTPFALPCNPNFEKMKESDYQEYVYESLPQTFRKLSAINPGAYEGAWELWEEGISQKLLMPQFHGREHINLTTFESKIAKKECKLRSILNNRSLARTSSDGEKIVPISEAFGFWDFEENNRFKHIIADGLNKFEEVFGYRAQNFAPPGYHAHPVLYDTLRKNGVRFVDAALISNQHQGNGRYKKQFNYTGKIEKGLHKIVRNVVFEPTDDRGVDWPSYAIEQTEAAFRWNRPAIISSHRVNFSGHINPQNREKGLAALKKLLKEMTQRWPDVEFMSANELGKLIEAE